MLQKRGCIGEILGTQSVVGLGEVNELLDATAGKIKLQLLRDACVILGDIHDHALLVERSYFCGQQILLELKVLLG